jgi:hypothetical protein
MKKDNSGYIALAAIAAYFLYMYYKKKKVAPVAPSNDLLMQNVKDNNILIPTMSIAPSGSITSELLTAPMATPEPPATYQTFYGESLKGVGKVPMTC